MQMQQWAQFPNLSAWNNHRRVDMPLKSTNQSTIRKAKLEPYSANGCKIMAMEYGKLASE